MKIPALLFLFLFLIPPATSAEPAGWPAFIKGDFKTARELGRTNGSAEALASACRAGMVQGGFVEEGPEAIASLHGAVRDCDKALQQDPSHFFAKMSLAIALSFEGKRLKRPAYPKQARAYLLELIDQEPNNPLGYGALAAWHSEVSAAGFLARMALGARRKKARANFEKALELGAIDYALKFEYVKFLARGNKSERKIALSEAKALMRETPSTAFDNMLRERVVALAAALEKGKKREIKAVIKESAAFQNAVPEKDVARFPLETLASHRTE